MPSRCLRRLDVPLEIQMLSGHNCLIAACWHQGCKISIKCTWFGKHYSAYTVTKPAGNKKVHKQKVYTGRLKRFSEKVWCMCSQLKRKMWRCCFALICTCSVVYVKKKKQRRIYSDDAWKWKIQFGLFLLTVDIQLALTLLSRQVDNWTQQALKHSKQKYKVYTYKDLRPCYVACCIYIRLG